MSSQACMEKLLKLTKENPTLAIMPFVHSDFYDEDYHYNVGSVVDCRIDDVCLYKGTYYTKDDFVDKMSDVFQYDFTYIGTLDEYVQYMVEEIEWTKVIVLFINV